MMRGKVSEPAQICPRLVLSVFSSLFNPQSSFWRPFGSLVDVLVLSVLWVFTSLPVITLGPATAALYDAAARCVRQGKSGALLRYFSTFRRELKQGALLSLIFLILTFLLLFPLRFFWSAVTADLAGARIALAAYAVFLVIPLGALCWVFPILSRFTFSLPGAVKVSFQLSLAYLPITFLLVLSALSAGLVSALYWAPVLILPCIVALLWSLPIERIFAKYTPSDSHDPSRDSEQ